MRVFVVLFAVLCGCSYETTNYYGGGDAGCIVEQVVDGGVTDMPGYTDAFGDYHETEPNQGSFKSDSKLQGNAILTLQPAPAAPAAGQPWPLVINTPARAGAQALLDLATRDGMPHVITIAMGFVGPPPAVAIGGGGNYPEIVALLEIGIGGIMIHAEIDFIDGFSFSMACSRLQLLAVYRLVPGGALVGTAETVQVGASVSTGTVAHGRQPQRTLASLVDLAPAANEVFIAPAFTKSMRVASVPNNTTPTVILWNNNGLQIASYPIAGFPSADLPVPNDTRLISYNNTALAADTDRRIICELAL